MSQEMQPCLRLLVDRVSSDQSFKLYFNHIRLGTSQDTYIGGVLFLKVTLDTTSILPSSPECIPSHILVGSVEV